jgi:NCAIR mutase (PurE)-related protein
MRLTNNVIKPKIFTPNAVLQLFQDLYKKKISPEEAQRKFKFSPYENLGFAKVDLHRHHRTGFPEIILSQGKTPKQVVSIAEKIYRSNGYAVASRVQENHLKALQKSFPSVVYREDARIAVIGKIPSTKQKPGIAILTAGTSDIPVAEEAAAAAELMGNKVEKIYDVGVAGVHRLLNHKEKIDKNKILIVAAGMEGALPSVTAGLFGKPVIAVPTSIGYGASFQGLAALLAMLNSCALGVCVMNIDNGLGAGYLASLLNR